MNLLKVAFRNLSYRPAGSLLSILLLALGVGLIALMLKVDRYVQYQVERNVQGVDMVLAAKGSPLQVILSSLLHIDDPTGNISLAEAQKIAKHPWVNETVPLSYGDNYMGFRIVGTEPLYLDWYETEIADGNVWEKSMEVVLGHEVAEVTGMDIGSTFHAAHGLEEEGHSHDEHDYRVVGLLAPSGTVLDRLILTATESVWQVHAIPSLDGTDKVNEEITAMLVRFGNPMGAMQIPRKVNSDSTMQAAIPQYEIGRLFKLLGMALNGLRWIAYIIMFVSGLSVFISLWKELQERQSDMALMRTYGASPGQLFILVLTEGLLLSLAGMCIGLFFAQMIPWLAQSAGELPGITGMQWWTLQESALLVAVIGIGIVSSLLPAWRAMRLDISTLLRNDR